MACVSAAVSALAGAGCGLSVGGASFPSGRNLVAGSCGPRPSPDASSPATIAVHTFDQKGAVIVLAPVCVDGQGPYPFILDTGAAVSGVDQSLVAKLHLRSTSGPSIAGVGCSGQSSSVAVSTWSLDGIPLPSGRSLPSVDVSGGGDAPAGLLGSDVLSRFGSFRLDYHAGRVTVPAPPPAPAAMTADVKVVRAEDQVVITAPVAIGGESALFAVDTGASRSVVGRTLAQRLHMPSLGTVSVRGVACASDASIVHISGWSMGGVALPAVQGDSISIPVRGLYGLVGSDVMSKLSPVTFDYAGQKVSFRS